MDEMKELNELNEKVEANRRKYQIRELERQQASRAKLTASLRQHNKLVALDMTLAGVLGAAVGVLVCFIF